MGNGWSIAWRILDSQFWGVPQRRRRIALVADFGGHSAPEILFVRQSVSGNFEPSKPKRKGASSDTEGGFGKANPYTLKIRSGCEGGGKGALIQTDKPATLSTLQDQTLFQPVLSVDQGGGKSACNVSEGQAPTLTCTHGGEPAVCYSIENHPADSRVNIDESGKVQTLTSRMGTGGGRETFNSGENFARTLGVYEDGINPTIVSRGPSAVCCLETFHCTSENGLAHPLKARDFKDPLTVAYAVDAYNQTLTGDKTKTLNSSATDSGHIPCVVNSSYIVRRLTPLECERLQGFPDGWTDIGEWMDSNGKTKKTSDSARYKALGNSIALPPWKWVLKRLCACYERDATMASLFDGIGGFPYIWEQLNGKGSCLWASEIEEFPIAVTKVRFGECT